MYTPTERFATRRPPPAGETAAPAVLLVDDRPMNLLALEEVLAPLGLELVRAGSGEEALRRVLERDFAVILLDVQMPGLDGFETARLIKERERSRSVPILFLTAIDTGPGRIHQAYAAGGADFVSKPFHPDVLRAKVAVFADLYAKTREVERLAREAAAAAAERRAAAELRAAWEVADARAAETAELNALLEEQAAELEQQVERSQALNRELEHALAQAEGARRAADAANRAKSQFLANMSHEIRTPINAIVGYTELMEMGLSGPLTEKQRAQLQRVRASGEHLRGLVNDILDLAKVEAGEMTVARAEVPACATAAGALALVAPQAEARAIGLSDTSDCSPEAAFLGDEDRVRQILANLLSNAVKFTEPGGSVTVACRVAPPGCPEAPGGEGPWVVMEVQDTGIGIAPDQLARVFEPFVQVEEGHTRTRGGTGLGLTISRRFARMMGGDLTVRSAPGRGSCFTLWLPAAPDQEEPRPSPEPAEAWHAGAGEVPGLAELGRLLADRAGGLVRTLGDRLRADPAVPGASGLDDAQLEDHIVTFLTGLGKALVTLDRGGAEPELLRAGMDIRRLISVRHGEQRARLGWSGDEVRREYGLLRDEVEALVRREWAARSEADVQEALGILLRLVDRSEQAALEGWGEARARAR